MANFYTEITQTATDLITEFGTTFTVRAESVYNPETRKATDGATRQVTGIVIDSNNANNIGTLIYPIGEVNQNWLLRKTLILTKDADPKPGEKVNVDGTWYSLARVQELKPADTVILYTLVLAE